MPTDDAPDTPPGSRLEVGVLLARALFDVLCWPFQLIGFLLTRGAQRRRFAASLAECSPLAEPTSPGGTQPEGEPT